MPTAHLGIEYVAANQNQKEVTINAGFDTIDTAVNAREVAANKGAASGYCPLDADSKVPTANLPIAAADFTKAPVAAPATATDTGTAGTWAYDATYLYVCVATNTWMRVALASW